jgi:aldehyde dehydrogenase (NAD+)
VILKPAPDTPWTATRLGRIVAEQTDIPPGVFNVVSTSDNAVAELLVTDPRVDLISFTGSTAVGQRIARAAGPLMKRLFLELGGKSANIVLDDADLSTIVPASAASICMHGGQGCAMLSRLLVPKSRYADAVELALAGINGVKYGDPRDPSTLQGPQVSARQRDRVLAYIDRGATEGATVVCGGGRPPHLPSGYFVEPTLIVDVDNSMTIAREEIFGPVIVVIPFDDDDDAVRIANDSIYGLSVGVSSGDEDRALAVAKRIKAGTASINGGVYYGADAPFGGYKMSGVGRQNGLEGFAQYTETKVIAGPAR